MRKMTVAALGAMLLLVMAISPAAAHGKPDRVVGNEPAVFEIEGSCEFPVLVEDSFARFQILTFGEDADGNVRSDIQATFRGTLTNEDTGASMPYVLAGRAALRFWADGRTSTAGSGTATRAPSRCAGTPRSCSSWAARGSGRIRSTGFPKAFESEW